MRMRKLFFLTLSLLFSLAVFGQKPQMAVYVTGEQNSDIHKKIGDELVALFLKGNIYQVFDKSADFGAELSQAASEHEIARVGKQVGVQFVCAVDIFDMFDTQYVSARLVDVERGEIVKTANTAKKLTNQKDLAAAANVIYKHLGKNNKKSDGDRYKVGIYVLGAESAVNKAIGDQLVEVVESSVRYVAVERTAQVLAGVSKEQNGAQNEDVDVLDIFNFCQQLGAQLVCIANVTPQQSITTHLLYVDDEEPIIIKSDKVKVLLNSMEEIFSISNPLKKSMKQSSLGEMTFVSEMEYLETEKGVPVKTYGESSSNEPIFQGGKKMEFTKWLAMNVKIV